MVIDKSQSALFDQRLLDNMLCNAMSDPLLLLQKFKNTCNNRKWRKMQALTSTYVQNIVGIRLTIYFSAKSNRHNDLHRICCKPSKKFFLIE